MSASEDIRSMVDFYNINFPVDDFAEDDFESLVYQFMGLILHRIPALLPEMCNLLLESPKTREQAMDIVVSSFASPALMDVLYVLLGRNNLSEEEFVSRVVRTYTKRLDTRGSANFVAARLYRIFVQRHSTL